MRDIALVPQHDVFQRRRDVSADHARQAGQIFRQHRVALVRHRRRALLALREELFGLEDFGALQVTDFGGEPLDRGGNHAERRKIHRVAIARNDLRRHRFDLEPHGFGDMRFDPRIEMGEGADRAGDRAGRNLLARRDQSFFRPRKLGVGVGELEPEGGRLGVDAMRAADGRGHLVLESALLQRGQHFVEVGDQNIGGASELYIEAGVEHVRRGQALVHEARFGTDDLGEMRGEGQHIVLDLGLDLLDARDVEGRILALGPDRLSSILRNDTEVGQRVSGVGFDFEPDLEARLGVPDRRHFGAGIAGDHAASPRASWAALRIAAMLVVYACLVPPLNTAEPATSTLAPAAITFGAVSGVMPPSTSMSIGRPATSARTCSTFSIAAGMKAWPPKPGLTDITSTRSMMSTTFSIELTGVAGLNTTPAFLPSARIACSERCRCGPASTCTVMMSEPACANASR